MSPCCTWLWVSQVSLRGKVDLPPDDVFNVLVDVDNHKIFKAIKARPIFNYRQASPGSNTVTFLGVTCIHNYYAQRHMSNKAAGLQAVSYRKVLRDDGAGRLDAEVEQIGQWKFLCFSGSFATRLFVYQDKRRGTVRSGKLAVYVTRQSRASRC